MLVSQDNSPFYPSLYKHFHSPINTLDCGRYCAPYNENGVPFCCDTDHMVPTAYLAEWEYLQANTDLWHLWDDADLLETRRLQAETPTGQVLIACQGHTHCQRLFRSLTCRAFPFFPYLTSQGEFIGLSVYWAYADRCWIISNLQMVSTAYRAEFIAAYDELFTRLPHERDTFGAHAAEMRRVFTSQHRAIPLLHRNGYAYKITPHNERARRVPEDCLPQYGPYRIPRGLRFSDEISDPTRADEG